MKKLYICLLLSFLITFCYSSEQNIIKRLKKYSGENRKQLIEFIKNSEGMVKEYVDFILSNCSPNDLAVLEADFIKNNIELALKSKQNKFCTYDDKIFKHFVLPYRTSQEPLDDFRAVYFDELNELIKEVEYIEEAAILINLWVWEKQSFKQTNGKDQSPLTTIRRGFGRCEENMIIYIAAARTVGIPVRPASVPYWNFTDSNHAWVEVWTPEGWKYLGEPENSLNRGWFSKTTERATLVVAEAFGEYDSENKIKLKSNATYLSSIKNYNSNSKMCKFTVKENGKFVKNADISLYAASFGGLFKMFDFQTGEKGQSEFPLGEGTVFVIAKKDNKFGYSLFNSIETDKIEIELNNDYFDNLELDFIFPLSNNSGNTKTYDEILGDEFYLRRELSDLRRKDKLNKNRLSKQFTKFFDQTVEDISFEEREKYLIKVDDLNYNSNIFLKKYEELENDKTDKSKILTKMIQLWDIKELTEIPDSLTLSNILDVYSKGKQRYNAVVSDSIFYNHVVGLTWSSANPVQTNWHNDLLELINDNIEQNIDNTVRNITKLADKHFNIDEDFEFSYFSGELNPMEIYNMKNIPEFYKTKFIDSSLRVAGIPVRWRGELEYFDGNEFVSLNNTNEDNELKKGNFILRVYIDDEQVKPEPWSNFLVSSLNKDFELRPIYFDGEYNSLDFNVNYSCDVNDKVYVQGLKRNSNGDANIKLISVEDQNVIELRINTIKIIEEYTNKWSEEIISYIKSISNFAGNQIILVTNDIFTEPEIRMLDQIINKAEIINQKNTEIILISENPSNYEKINESKIEKRQFINRDFYNSEFDRSHDYPVIFLLNNEKEILFSSKGYHMGIADLLIEKLISFIHKGGFYMSIYPSIFTELVFQRIFNSSCNIVCFYNINSFINIEMNINRYIISNSSCF